MWPFGSKKKTMREVELMKGFTDWHSHILPGVDDGVPTMEKSLQILKEYEKIGVRRVWLTPHIMEDIPNTTDGLRQRYAELLEQYKGPVELRLAAENMLDNLFEERLEANDFLPIGSEGNHLLVETSYYNPPMDLFGSLSRLKSAGYHPVLAHPERYLYMEKRDYDELLDMGVKFQLNLSSLSGGYGQNVVKRAQYLIDKDAYTLTGSDLHRLHVLERFTNAPIKVKTLNYVAMLHERGGIG